MEVSKPSPKDKKNRKVYCAIQNCSSKSSRDTHLSFHKFPKVKSHLVPAKNFFGNIEKVDVLTAWIKATKIKNVGIYIRKCVLSILPKKISSNQVRNWHDNSILRLNDKNISHIHLLNCNVS